jgi:hypothetical protein
MELPDEDIEALKGGGAAAGLGIPALTKNFAL